MTTYAPKFIMAATGDDEMAATQVYVCDLCSAVVWDLNIHERFHILTLGEDIAS